MQFIGDNLRKFRTEYDYSREKLASKLKVTSRTIQNWEEEVTVPTSDHLAKMTKIFKKDFYMFFEPVTYKAGKSRVNGHFKGDRSKLPLKVGQKQASESRV